MEIYLAIAYMIRWFELTLFETTDKDLQWDDMVVPEFHDTFRTLTKRRTS